MDPASLTIAVVGAVAAGASAIMAWVARADSLRAEEKADKARAQAQAAAERATAATEQMSMMQASVFNSPPWALEWSAGDTYLLTNTSSVDAIDVSIDCPAENVAFQVGMDSMPGEVGARSAIKLMIVRSMGSGWVVELVVKWRRPHDDELHTWKYPVPPRPKR